MGLTSTHTFAELEVSPDTYDEIAEKLRVAEYDHAFMDDGTIDMHGIGLTKGKITISNDGGKSWREPTSLDEPLIISRGSFEAPAATVKKYGPKILAALNNPSMRPVSSAERAGTCKCPYPPVVNEDCWCHAQMGNDYWLLPADQCAYETPNGWRAFWRKVWAAIT